MDEYLKFRRQFLLARASIPSLAHWTCLRIANYYLYTHPDLDVSRTEDTMKSVVLIGSMFDADEPEKENADILKDIMANGNRVEDFVSGIKRYAGSYALLYRDNADFFIVQDALALREVYYCTLDNLIVCGSQPNLVAKFSNPEIRPTTDPDFLDYYRNHLKDPKWWIGDETYYESVKHLLPNHYFDINRRAVGRYWPDKPIKRLELDEAVSTSSAFLQGIMAAMAHRYPLMVAVTAGTDTRTVLAASRGIKDKVYYFVNNQGLGYDHPDVSVPRKIFQGIGVPFHVHDVPLDVNDEFRQTFLSNVFFASERILPSIYNVYFKKHADKVNILGIGEIGRTRFGKVPRNLNGYRMAYKLGYREGRYPVRQGEKILTELLPVAKEFALNVMTLLYWEHGLGNWGAIGNSESDIAIEEINPFDSHLLYEILLGVDDSYTQYHQPALFREMIRRMWPELLEWPINPPYTVRGKVASFLSEIGLFDLLKEFKYQMNYIRYLWKARIS